MKIKNDAHFEVVFNERGFLVIHDLDLNGASVTNDIENVLAQLSKSGYELPALKIMYLDSMKLYDAVLVNPDGTFKSFAPIHCNDLSMALDIYDTRYENQCFKHKSLMH